MLLSSWARCESGMSEEILGARPGIKLAVALEHRRQIARKFRLLPRVEPHWAPQFEAVRRLGLTAAHRAYAQVAVLVGRVEQRDVGALVLAAQRGAEPGRPALRGQLRQEFIRNLKALGDGAVVAHRPAIAWQAAGHHEQA